MILSVTDPKVYIYTSICYVLVYVYTSILKGGLAVPYLREYATELGLQVLCAEV